MRMRKMEIETKQQQQQMCSMKENKTHRARQRTLLIWFEFTHRTHSNAKPWTHFNYVLYFGSAFTFIHILNRKINSFDGFFSLLYGCLMYSLNQQWVNEWNIFSMFRFLSFFVVVVVPDVFISSSSICSLLVAISTI